MAERRFIAMRVEQEEMASLLSAPGQGLILNLDQPVSAYNPEDWRLVSHTFTLTPAGVGIISFVFERK